MSESLLVVPWWIFFFFFFYFPFLRFSLFFMFYNFGMMCLGVGLFSFIYFSWD